MRCICDWLPNNVNLVTILIAVSIKNRIFAEETVALSLHRKQIYRIMVVISTRDFRTNQTKYLNLAKAGEHVVLKSRAGSFRIFPDDGGDTIDAPRDLMKELRNALTEVKEAIAGKRKLQSADSLLDEL